MKQITELRHRILSFSLRYIQNTHTYIKAIIVPIRRTHTDKDAGKYVYVNPAYLANPAHIALHILHDPKTHRLSTQYSKHINNNSTWTRR